MGNKLEEITGKPNGRYVDSKGNEVKPELLDPPYIKDVFNINEPLNSAERVSKLQNQNQAYANANAYSLINICYIDDNSKCELTFRLYRI